MFRGYVKLSGNKVNFAEDFHAASLFLVQLQTMNRGTKPPTQ